MTAKEVMKYWKKVNRAKAIKELCLQCSGGSPTEVTLCPMVDCPVWGWRFGNSFNSKAFLERMEGVKKRNPKEFDSSYSYLLEGK